MKKKFYAVISALLFALPAMAAYELMWSDEFDGSSLDTDIWNYEIGTGDWGWGNGESQYYTSREDNLKLSDGQMVITALKESYRGSSYTSARITTADKLTAMYGRFEALIKLPEGKSGVWPAYWMLGTGASNWPYCGEIDIMEYMCSTDESSWKQVLTTYHWNNGSMDDSYYTHASHGGTLELGEQPGTKYRIYGLEWTPDYLIGYVADEPNSDNRTTFAKMEIGDYYDRSNGLAAFHYPAYFIFNLAVGGTYVGDNIDANLEQAQMYVEYLRVYQDYATYPDSYLSVGYETDAQACVNPFESYTAISNSLNDNGNWYAEDGWMSYSGTTITATPPSSYTNMYIVVEGIDNGLISGTEYTLSGTLTATADCSTVLVYVEDAADNSVQMFTDNRFSLTANTPYAFSMTETCNTTSMTKPCVVLAADNNPAGCTFTLSDVVLVASDCDRVVPSPVEETYDSAEAIVVTASQGTVYCDRDFRIINLSGIDVTAYNGSLKGIYIVIVGDQSLKIMVN